MSWTDLFKSRSGSSKSDPSIRWFGKLPTYSDYYRSPSDEDWATEFNSWVLKGFERYRGMLTEAGKPYVKLPLASAVIRMPKYKMTVIATVLDYGGDMRGRPFPLLFYAGLPTSSLNGPTSETISSIWHAMSQLLSLRREVARFINSPGSLDHVFGDREIDLLDVIEGHKSDEWRHSGKSLLFSDWFTRALPGLAAATRAEWFKLIETWGSRIQQQNGKNFEPTLRFPLAARMSREVQIAGWLHWLGARMKLSDRKLTLLVTGDPDTEAGQLTIVARDLMDDDFLLLTPFANDLPFVDSLCAAPSLAKDSPCDNPSEPDAAGEAEQPPQTSPVQASDSSGEGFEAEKIRTDAGSQERGAPQVDDVNDDGRSWLDFVSAATPAP